MTRALVSFLLGSRDLCVPGADSDRAAELLTASGADLRRLRRTERGLEFSLPLYDCGKVTRILAARGIHIETLRERGAYALLRRFRGRIGIPIGAALLAGFLLFSENLVWSVEYKGNERVTDRVVEESLERLGFRVGAFIPSLDLDELHAKFLLENRDFAWIAVNIAGTHATVELLEVVENEPVPDELEPHNLVAAENAVVRSLEVYRGKRCVEPGQLVREGELLVSGVIETNRGITLCHSRGSVLAEVVRNISVEIPLESEVKVATGREFVSITINILGFSVNLFDNTGNSPPTCDKILEERSVTILDGLTLPVTISYERLREYRLEAASISSEEARRLAFEELNRRILALDGDLLSREVSGDLDGNRYALEARLTMLVDIAREQPILAR